MKIKRCLISLVLIISLLILIILFGQFDIDKKKTRTKSICIATLDSRFTKEDVEMSSLNDLKELKLFWNEKMERKNNLISKILFLNKSYTIKHNLKFFVSNCSNCEKWKQNDTLHEAWMKLNFVEELMSTKQNKCDFVMWLDSDAYIWNLDQRIDLYDWFSGNSISEENENYIQHSSHLILQKYYDLFQQNKTLFIAKNGVIKNVSFFF